MTSKTRESGRVDARSISVRALRRLTKAEAFVQFQQNPELASTISGAARRWGCSRSTARQWLSEFTAPPVATAPAAMAMPMAATDAAMATLPSSADAAKAALSDLCDALENISPQHVVDSCDEIEILGFHGDCQMAATWLAAAGLLAEAALRRAR
jgi:Homeodomain-like domain